MGKSSCSILRLPPYKKGPVLSQSPPLQLGWDCPGQGPTWPNSQLSPASAPSLHRFTTSSLFPSLRLQATRCRLVLLKSCLAGEGAINPTLSQESCSRPGRRRPGGCSRPGPHAGPRDLFVLKQSPYLLLFQCPLWFLVSYLHKRWGAVGCSLCSSVDWVGDSFRCRGKLTPPPPILLSSLDLYFCLVFFFTTLNDNSYIITVVLFQTSVGLFQCFLFQAFCCLLSLSIYLSS